MRQLSNWLSTRPIAHRGLHDGNRSVPENSLAACAAAVAAGHPIEIDLHRLADGGVAVFHDATLERMTGACGRIGDRKRKDLPSLRLLATSETIPTLDEVLKLVRGRVPLLLELKNPDAVGALERAVLAALAGYTGDVAVQSFNPFSVGYFQQQAPWLLRGQLAGDFRDATLSPLHKLALSNLLLNSVSQPYFIAYDLRALPHWATTVARTFGKPVLAWTVRDRAGREVARQHADNFIFETLDDLS